MSIKKLFHFYKLHYFPLKLNETDVVNHFVLLILLEAADFYSQLPVIVNVQYFI